MDLVGVNKDNERWFWVFVIPFWQLLQFMTSNRFFREPTY